MENINRTEPRILKSDPDLIRLRERVDFSHSPKIDIYPDLLNVQLQAYDDFLQEGTPPKFRKSKGLQLAFNNNFPIEDASSIFQLEFIEYSVEKAKYNEDECRERELTYAKPLKAKLRLSSKAEKNSEDYIESVRSEERRVGKECRSRGSRDH